MDPLREALYDHLWRLGIIIRNRAKREGLLGGFESILTLLAPRIVPPPAQETRVTLPLGMQMTVPPNFLSYRNFATGLYEKDLTKLFLEIVKDAMIIVDIGANIGYYTLLASRKIGPSGRVYAFEPDNRNYGYLVKNVSDNHGDNVVTVRKAVFNKIGVETLIHEGGGERNWLQKGLEVHGATRVDTTTLDSYFASENWPLINLVKMDIEGSEAFALEGMRELSRKNPQMQLIVELNIPAMQRAKSNPSVVLNLAQELGFSRGFIIERNLKSFFLDQGLPQTNAIYNILLTKSDSLTHLRNHEDV